MGEFREMVALAALDAVAPPGQPSNLGAVKLATLAVRGVHVLLPEMPVPDFKIVYGDGPFGGSSGAAALWVTDDYMVSIMVMKGPARD